MLLIYFLKLLIYFTLFLNVRIKEKKSGTKMTHRLESLYGNAASSYMA